MTGLPLTAWYRFGIWMALGAVVYFLYGYGHSKLRDQPQPARTPPA
jgi:basic amino acid/polyamine antiporter, APA family